MSFLTQTLLKHIKFKADQLVEISSVFQVRELPRKTLLVKAGELTQQLVLIETGYLRMYRLHEGKESTVWLGGAGQFVTSISSFIDQRPSLWNIEALTDSKVHAIKRDSHFNLCDRHREWLEFENLLLAKAMTGLEFRNYELMSLKAEERYKALFQKNPTLFLDVPAKYIASLLGISEETLSRLKKGDRDFS